MVANDQERVTVTEVSLRDGLQDLPVWVPTATKAQLVERLREAGLVHIEVTSFMRADRIPQLADADELSVLVSPNQHSGYSALIPNQRGLRRALAAGYRQVTVVLSATDAHNRENLGRSTAELIPLVESVIQSASQAGVRVRAAVSVAFGCPFEGPVPPDRVLTLAARLLAAGADEISLADTVGQARPEDIERLVTAVVASLGSPPSVHLHALPGAGAENVLAAVAAGVRHLDASLTGIGGCPYAPGAPGNVPTEQVAAVLPGRTGLDLDRLEAAAAALRAALRAAVPLSHPGGMIADAGDRR